MQPQPSAAGNTIQEISGSCVVLIFTRSLAGGADDFFIAPA